MASIDQVSCVHHINLELGILITRSKFGMFLKLNLSAVCDLMDVGPEGIYWSGSTTLFRPQVHRPGDQSSTQTHQSFTTALGISDHRQIGICHTNLTRQFHASVTV